MFSGKREISGSFEEVKRLWISWQGIFALVHLLVGILGSILRLVNKFSIKTIANQIEKYGNNINELLNNVLIKVVLNLSLSWNNRNTDLWWWIMFVLNQ